MASPHARNDSLEATVRTALPGISVVRVWTCEELTVSALELLSPEWVFFPHWSSLIPPAIYERFECVIFHMTDVPYGRGGSPLQNLIVRGHRDTVISALRCTAELDAGPVFLKRQLSLSGTAEEILIRASEAIAGMILEMVRHRPNPQPQIGDVVTFTRRRASEGDLSRLSSARQIYDQIRMLDGDGYPSAFLETEYLHMDFRGARLDDGVVEATVRIRSKVK